MTNEERRDRTAELNNLRAENGRREKALAADGVKLGNETVMLGTIRALKELVLGDDEDRRLTFDVMYQRQVEAMLDEVEADVRKRKLSVANGRLVRP